MCTVDNCATCSAAAVCSMCGVGYSHVMDGSECKACSDGCSECASQCSCQMCVETGKTAPNCGCAADETWSASKMICDGEAVPETMSDDGSGAVAAASANVMKFFVSALVALIAFL